MYCLKKSVLFYLLIGGVLSFQSCKNDNNNGPEENPIVKTSYGVTVEVAAAGESYSYILETDDLMKEGVISPVGAGIDVTGKFDGTYGISRDNHIFSPEGSAIMKYAIINKNIKETGNTVITNVISYLGMMKTVFVENNLNFITWDSQYNAESGAVEKHLFSIDTATMNIKTDNVVSFTIPDKLIPDPDHAGEYYDKSKVIVSPTNMGIANGKLYVGFLYLSPSWAPPSKQVAYVLTADYPSMANAKITSNDQYGQTSGTWFQSQSSFFDEKGDYYFTTVKNGKDYTLLRIKAGTTDIDETYAYDLSAYNIYLEGYSDQQYDHHTYLKNGKALFGGVVVDIYNKQLVKDLDQAGLGTVAPVSADGILVDGSKAYMFVKTTDAKWFVAQYDADTDEFKRGIQIDGGVTAANRIVKY